MNKAEKMKKALDAAARTVRVVTRRLFTMIEEQGEELDRLRARAEKAEAELAEVRAEYSELYDAAADVEEEPESEMKLARLSALIDATEAIKRAP